MLRHKAAVALVAWTFIVWTARISNIWRDADLGTADKWGRTALALSFTALAVAAVGALWHRARRALVIAVAGLAGWTSAVWVVRGAGLVAGDHAVGFKVVHTVLALVSIALAGLAWRETRRTGAPDHEHAADGAAPAPATEARSATSAGGERAARPG